MTMGEHDTGRELAERPDRMTRRDDLTGQYRAVSDVLDDYLMREHGRITSHNGWDLFLDLLAEQGYEVRALGDAVDCRDGGECDRCEHWRPQHLAYGAGCIAPGCVCPDYVPWGARS